MTTTSDSGGGPSLTAAGDPSHDPTVAALLGQLERAFDRRSWHGTNLMGSLRRLDAGAAAWRPDPARHNAWEVVVHAAYWKYRLCRHLAADPPASFSIPGSDWWVRPDPETAPETAPETGSGAGSAGLHAAWKADVALLREWHGRLLAAVAALDPARLHEPATSQWSTFDLVAGGAAHDLYHAGQIQLLKRMRSAAPER